MKKLSDEMMTIMNGGANWDAVLNTPECNSCGTALGLLGISIVGAYCSAGTSAVAEGLAVATVGKQGVLKVVGAFCEAFGFTAGIFTDSSLRDCLPCVKKIMGE